MKYQVGDILVHSSPNGERAVVTIIDYVFRHYCDEYVFVLEHKYISANGECASRTFDANEDYIGKDSAYKQYTYYPVVK